MRKTESRWRENGTNQVPNQGPDIAKASDKFFPNKRKSEMAESPGCRIKQTGAGITN